MPLPPFTTLLGRRRGWLLFVQILLALAILALGAADPREQLGWMAALAVLVAFLSASQDIVIDAYRVELLEERQQGAGAAVIVIGYRIAMLVAGAGALLIAEHAGWFWAYAAMAGCLASAWRPCCSHRSPRLGRRRRWPRRAPRVAGWLSEAVVEPFADFLRRNGAGPPLLILLFIMLYKLGDALLGTMTNPFYVELGFTKPEVATIVKGYGLVATLARRLPRRAGRQPAGRDPGLVDLRPGPDRLQPGLRPAGLVGHDLDHAGADDLGREPRRRHGHGGVRRLSQLLVQPQLHGDAVRAPVLVHGAGAHHAVRRRRLPGREHELDRLLPADHRRRPCRAS